MPQLTGYYDNIHYEAKQGVLPLWRPWHCHGNSLIEMVSVE